MASSQYSSGRFPKVSIGIRVQKSYKAGPEQTKKDDVALPDTIQQRKSLQEDLPRETSISGTVQNCNTKMKSRDQNASAKSSEFLERPIESHALPEQSPTVNTKKVMPKKLASEAYQADRGEKSSEWISTKDTFESFAKQALIKEPQDGMGKNAERLDAISDHERMGEIKFTTLEQTHVSDKSVSRDHGTGIKHDNEALRVKLWEILGPGSPSKQVLSSSAHVETIVPNKKEREGNQNGVMKAKPNSDPIETDSESPNPTPQRPATRSLTRKRNLSTSSKNIRNTKKSGKLPLSSSSPASKLNSEDKSIFTFNETETKGIRLNQHTIFNASSFKEKCTELEKARIDPLKIHFPVKLNSEKISLVNGNYQRVPTVDKESPRSHQSEPSPCPPVLQEDDLKTPNGFPNLNKDLLREHSWQTSSPLPSNSKPLKHSDGWKNKAHSSEFMAQTPRAPQKANEVITPSIENTKTPSTDFNSPTFALNASAPSTRNKLLDDDLPTPETKGSCTSDESYTPEADSPITETDSSISTRVSLGLRETKLPYNQEHKETKRPPSLSPMEDAEDMSFKRDCFFTKGYKTTDKWFSDVGSLGQPTVKFHRRKTTDSPKCRKISKHNLSASSPIGASKTGETIDVHEVLDQLPEDSMERIIYQLALILQGFKSKMKTQAGKKSSEILSSITEKVHMQLQDAASQIEANLDNFISTNQTKRKRVELRLQEVSQKKLLLQVENSIETELNDAERKVTELNKDAGRKMKQLKGILKQWMADCVT